MKKSKKIFLALAILFLLIIFYIAYDMSTRTTFPGSRNREEPVDTVLMEENSRK